MTLCPGKKGPSLYGPPWDRSLDTDREAVRNWRPNVVVSLMESQEFESLGVPDFGAEVEQIGLQWLHLPMPDTEAPDTTFDDLWLRWGPHVRDIVRRGGRVLLHCRGGLGRTGTLAAQLLVEFGLQPEVPSAE